MQKPDQIYNSYLLEHKDPFGAVKTGQVITFRLKLQTYDNLANVFLKISLIDQPDTCKTIPLTFEKADFLNNIYSCNFSSQTAGLFEYYFEITSTSTDKVLCNNSVACINNGVAWQLTVYDADMKTPKVLEHATMYQIFPDRFYNSGKVKENVPADRTLRSDWGSLPEWKPNKDGIITNSDYFCGDIPGITQKLDYIASLGVTVIYINPIFEAQSNHRYDTSNYLKIDTLLGNIDDFKELCEKSSEKGISIILDGVFSHTGSDSIYFNKQGRYGDTIGAYRDPNSPYIPWYKFTHYPDQYESWWGIDTMPNINETEATFMDYICEPAGVLSHWLDSGASGFRLDVVDELPDKFLDRLCATIKSKSSDYAVIGEVWEDASNKISYGVRRKYLQGKQLDSVMNYPFKDAILDYVRYGKGNNFYLSVMNILDHYPEPVINCLMNSLSTHDTPRAITVLAGSPMQDSREWQAAHHYLTPEEYSHGKNLLLLATILQFALPGMPCIYYGDEAGLSGYRDPFNRVCYPWDYQDHDLIENFKAISKIRKDFSKLANSRFIPICITDNICLFARKLENEALLYCINRSSSPYALPRSDYKNNNILYSVGSLDKGVLSPFSGAIIHLYN